MFPVKDLIFSFVGGVIGMSVWYYLGIVIFRDLYTMELSYLNVLTHYAIPIQVVATTFFYLELYAYKGFRKK